MKRILFAIIILSSLLGVDCPAEKKPGNLVPFADPFILYEDGIYYMYGTGPGARTGIPVICSKDLKKWEWPEGKEGYMALHMDDCHAKNMFWAPEVYHIGNKYIMYYTAEEHICVAEADSPLGPFKQLGKGPMRSEKGIDNHLFIDKDGKPYLFWANFAEGLQIWVAELEDDMMTIKKGTEKFCTGMSQDWEKVWPSVNEGPFVIENGGTYYLTYSANSYESQNYGIGLAMASDPMGPWVKYEANPIFQLRKGLYGIGHHAFFKDAKGKDRIVFHSHNSSESIHPRVIHVGKFKIKNGIIKISDRFFTTEME